jgi:hypothetical protein
METSQIKKYSIEELLHGFGGALEVERKASHVVLLYLAEIAGRRLYADMGYGSLFELLVRHFRLSESSVNNRLKALALMNDVSEAKTCLARGEVNLSTLAQAQRQILAQEKLLGQRVSLAKKAEIVEAIKNKTQTETEKVLHKLLPEAALAPKNTEKRVTGDQVRLGLCVPDQFMQKLKRLKELWAHVNPSMDNVEAIERALDHTLKSIDPMMKPPRVVKQSATAAVKRGIKGEEQDANNEKKAAQENINEPSSSMGTSPKITSPKGTNPKITSPKITSPKGTSPKGKRLTYYSVNMDRELWRRADSQCEFVSKLTGLRCPCTFGLGRDHIVPLAKGGANELGNLRLLCRAHNALQARRHFGREKIERKIAERTTRTEGKMDS